MCGLQIQTKKEKLNPSTDEVPTEQQDTPTGKVFFSTQVKCKYDYNEVHMCILHTFLQLHILVI